ncbi:myosin-1 isoform X2 [Brachypodium distachyon]|uniref:Uncharacterized protein n=1 Tax=Brachypodium distachyon TaxID=15368 RepID=A0A0Q3F1M9_BRADI|nr:myosin-1 isoform X2 [Brachypodium distachyon]KQJ93430.1 hypothetical protein BRADI_3g04554v3 [Brachypodium distachyon]|eukprot:XP_014756208.1 myosin-1 isoform X2 [Brachypodium distachyon]
MSVVSTSALSSLEAVVSSLIGRSGGGDETQTKDDNDVSDDAVDSPPPPPPLPVRPNARGRLPSLPRVAGAAAAPWTPLSSPSPHKEGAAEVSAAVMAGLERKAAEAEARLRRKEEENTALRQQIESYHIRWLQHEIRIKSLEEAFHEQLASLQMVRDAAARRARDRESSLPPPPPCYRHGRVSGELHRKTSEDVAARRRGAAGRLGEEFRRGSQALESGAAALEKPTRPPWQPGVPNADAMGDLKKLGTQFRAWKKEYKARLRKAKAEIDRNRRRRSTCWI